mgnify:CR=1 FL=1
MSEQSQAYRAIEKYMKKKHPECPECKSFKLLNIGNTIIMIGIMPVLIAALIIFKLSGVYYSLGVITVWILAFFWQRTKFKCQDCRQSFKSVKGEDGTNYLEWETNN